MAQTRNGGPACPKIERLDELMDWLNELHQTGANTPPERERENVFNETIQEVITALDWTHTMLSNRAGYQKKQQFAKKIRTELFTRQLSADELAEVDRQVEAQMKNWAGGDQ